MRPSWEGQLTLSIGWTQVFCNCQNTKEAKMKDHSSISRVITLLLHGALMAALLASLAGHAGAARLATSTGATDQIYLPLVMKPNASDAGPISSGKILFVAHNTTNPDADLRLFVMNDDGTGLTNVSDSLGCAPLLSCDSPDIEDMPGGGWRIAYIQDGGINVFDTKTGEATVMPGKGGRPDFNSDASDIVFMGGGAEGLNIWRMPADGSSAAIQLTDYGVSLSAEFPYFSPIEDKIVYVAPFGDQTRGIMDGDGSNSVAIPPPGGNTVSHMSFNADGTEFVNAQNLTSYSVQTGAIGRLNDLKNTTTIMSQLLAFGYEEVPTTKVLGQGGMGTFALSVDWSRDGKMLVFDALVQDAKTSSIKGIAIFIYAIETDKLTLIFGPEPYNGKITNNFNFSTYTPKWIP
jgi:hypothetical protein